MTFPGDDLIEAIELAAAFALPVHLRLRFARNGTLEAERLELARLDQTTARLVLDDSGRNFEQGQS